MTKLKVALAAAALCAGLGMTSVAALPVGQIGPVELATDAQTVRMVCNQFGRCWYQRSYARVYYGGRHGYRGRHC